MRGGLLINYAESYDSASCLIRKIYLGQYWKIFDISYFCNLFESILYGRQGTICIKIIV